MPAYSRHTLLDFARVDPSAVLGQLAEGYTRDGFASQFTGAIIAWEEQIQFLQTVACGLAGLLPASADWHLLLEYPIPRRSKRIDAVLLAADLIFVPEFKTGERAVTPADARQVEDYCLDLRDFHAGSTGRTLIPLLVAPHSPPQTAPPQLLLGECVQPVQIIAGPSAADRIADCFRVWHRPDRAPIDGEGWDRSPYCPTPTIIEAAQRLYATHNVQEITRSHAGADNLTRTAQAVLRVIAEARARNRKAICFVTGVPGAELLSNLVDDGCFRRPFVPPHRQTVPRRRPSTAAASR
jgi:hypothetical protein